MEVKKEYEYMKDGRKVCIRRSYKVKGLRTTKKEELDEYFKNNAESIKASKKIDDILTDYNNSHDNKISFSMMYQKYKAIFGTRKSQITSSEDDEKVDDCDNSAPN